MSQQQKTGGQLHGILAVTALVLYTILLFIPVLFIGLVKLIPNKRWQVWCTRMVDKVVIFWSDSNRAYINYTQTIHWDIEGMETLNPKDWYLLVANHQSWLDIVVLQYLFNRKIPMIKFFIKDQLKWVPILGFCWWAMGCPFMKRYSKEYLLKYPEKKGKDLQATRKAVEIFKHSPAAIMNFIEGTRFTDLKKEIQQSPYQHLLKPKAGGIGFVISTMGKQINKLLDVTIVYPDKQHSLWDFLCQRMTAIKIRIRLIPIPVEFTQPQLIENEKIQQDFRLWLNEQWEEKDQLIDSLKTG